MKGELLCYVWMSTLMVNFWKFKSLLFQLLISSIFCIWDCRVSNYPAFFLSCSRLFTASSIIPNTRSWLFSSRNGAILMILSNVLSVRLISGTFVTVMVSTSFLFLRFLSILVVHIVFYVLLSYTVFTGHWHT